MARSVIHTPWDLAEAKQVGARMFRKQLLPIGKVEHDGETLDFNKAYLGKLVKNFTAGKRDQVPVVLVDSDNKHVSDPEKYRGDVKTMELASDGLYITAELSEDGTKLIKANPKLGISARIDRATEDIEHVAATLNPVIKGMSPWEAVELSNGDDVEVLDFSGLQFPEAGQPNGPSSSDPVAKDFSDAEQKQLAALLKKGGKEAATKALKETDLSDEEIERTIAEILDEAETDTSTDTEKDKDKQPVPALSEKHRKAIELAQSTADEAKREAAEAKADLARERFEAKRTKLVEAGVPPAIVELAEPILKGGAGTIELSNGTKVDAHNAVERILDECEGMIDLSEIGRRDVAESDENADLLESWEREDPQGSKRAREREAAK